jgi:hypothetical protein
MFDLASSRWLDLVQTSSGWTGPTSTVVPSRVIRRRPLYAEMVASAALVEFDRSDLCKGTRSCLIISVPGGAVTKCASGVSSGILVHQNRAQFVAKCEVAHAAINPFSVRSFITSQALAAIRSTAALPSVRQCCTVRRRGMSGNKRK